MSGSGSSEEKAAPAAKAQDSDLFSQSGLPRRFGRYHLLRLIARGGMGQVFLASTTGVEGAERPVVVKVIRREHAKDPNFLARFLDEARVQSQLVHSGVAQVLEADTHEPTGDPYVVIEYVEGRSLGNIRQRIAEVGLRLGWEDAVAIGALVTEALAHVHERRDARGKPLGIVHRDLSPHNVMLGYAGDIKIIDFGTARGQNRRCHTVAGVVFAKPGYVAPEVANGDSGDARVDLYAAGIMLWELCAGRRFLQGDAAEHLAEVARGKRNPPPIARMVGAPERLDQIIEKLTAFDRDERYETARTAAAHLGEMLSSAEPLPNGERGVRARAAQLMYSLYPDEPAKSRRRFQRLVSSARKCDEPWEPAPEARDAAESLEDPLNMLTGSRYRIRGVLGRGASSVVYEAQHVDLGRRVAIKVLAAEHTDSRDFAARFRKEARALSRLAHPGLVRIYDFGQNADGQLYSVMELLEGQTLRKLLDDDETIGWKRALRIAHRCLMALHVAHESGVVHRDIKPGNIFLTAGDRIKLIDFGLAKTAEEVLGEVVEPRPEDLGPGEPIVDRLGAMTLFGTPEYMAPEQVAGGRVDARADLYSLGCVLYEMLTGRLPFGASGAVALVDAKLKGSPESLAERAPNRKLPRSVNRLVMKALARHPSRRFRTAHQMAAAIEEVLDEPTRRRARRRLAAASALAGIMAFSVVLLGREVAPVARELPGSLPWRGEGAARPPQPVRAWPHPTAEDVPRLWTPKPHDSPKPPRTYPRLLKEQPATVEPAPNQPAVEPIRADVPAAGPAAAPAVEQPAAGSSGEVQLAEAPSAEPPEPAGSESPAGAAADPPPIEPAAGPDTVEARPIVLAPEPDADDEP